MIAVPPATAASFDLLLNGHWAYNDLTLLADAHLLEGYDNGQELTAVFPLTRYEVALLVEEVLVLRDQWDEQNDISADTLMWEILKSKAKSGKVQLSTEIVAQARRDSEGAYKALTRLTKEFGNELYVLGSAGKGILPSLTSKAGARGSKEATITTASKKSFLHGKNLASLGTTQLLSVVPSVSHAANGYTLSNGLGVEVRSLGVSPWQNYYTAIQHRNSQAMESHIDISSSLTGETERDNTYAPVDVMALVGYSIEQPHQALQAPGDTQFELAEGSLRLYPDMTGKRPMGLLTSYFLGRMPD